MFQLYFRTILRDTKLVFRISEDGPEIDLLLVSWARIQYTRDGETTRFMNKR